MALIFYTYLQYLKQMTGEINLSVMMGMISRVNSRVSSGRSSACDLILMKYLEESLIYSSKVLSNFGTKENIGVTKNTFKELWDGHNFATRHVEYRHRTTFANYIWSLKEGNIPFGLI